MISARWSEVKERLQTALEMTAAERTAYLEELGAADPELRREVESLLDSHDQAGDTFMSAPAIEFAEPEPPHSAMIGRRVGSYRIVEWLGAGGMGEVYRAARADEQFEKQVALKLVRGGPDSAFVIGRFKNERQILAQLDHPNIARLLDGGTTDEGVPYFVMELVEGQPIDEYCDAHGLSVNERLGLFRQVCSAVQYAHQLLIIHRDIKPGNILVTAEGVPKLLDFGIAKILSGQAGGEAADATMTAFAALTPGYASPEQVMGKPITTASDVYSLGVVLYELLTGRRPYRINSHAPQEIVRAVCETDPEKPSTAVTRVPQAGSESGETIPTPSQVSAVRDGSPEKLRKRLEGDLDNIVLMALRKEPMRRYATVEQFSQDIERHLGHLPVIARKSTVAYRTGKFVARYRTGMAAAVVVTLALAVGFVVSLREARIAREERARAERRFNDVRNLSDTMLFKIDDSIKDLPGSTEAQHLLISSAQQYLDGLSKEASGDVSLLRDLANGYEKLGMIQGSFRGPSLGNSAAAVESLRKAVALREAIAKANPNDLRTQYELEKSYEQLIDPLFAVSRDETAVYVDKTVKLAETLNRENPDNADILHALILAYEDKGQTLTHSNDMAGATVIETKNVELATQLESKVPNPSNQTLLSYEHKRLGGLLIAQKKYPQALGEYQAAQSLDEVLLRAHPTDPKARFAITFNLSDMGYIEWKQGNLTAALDHYKKVLGIREALAAEDAHDAHAKAGVARTCGYLGNVMRAEKKPEEALRYDQRRLSILTEQAAQSPGDRPARVDIGNTDWDIGADYMAIAEAAKEKSERVRQAEVAHRYLLEAQAAIAEGKAQGLLYGDLVKAPEEIAQDLKKCEAVIGGQRGGVNVAAARR